MNSEENQFVLLGKHLRMIRNHACKGAPKSQHVFADELGWTQKAFSVLESKGKEKPLPKKLVVILHRMGCVGLLEKYLDKVKTEGEES